MKCDWEKCVREAAVHRVSEDGIEHYDLCEKHDKKLSKAFEDFRKGKNIFQTFRTVILACGGLEKMMRGDG